MNKSMNKIEQLAEQRQHFEQAIANLRACLMNFERPINILLADKKTLSDMSIQECIQITNLLLEMYKDAEPIVQEPTDPQETYIS